MQSTFEAVHRRHNLSEALPAHLQCTVRINKSIVAEIEKQFSRLDEAVANLKRVKANLKRYKAAVLKAAVEGKFGSSEPSNWTRTNLGAFLTPSKQGRASSARSARRNTTRLVS